MRRWSKNKFCYYPAGSCFADDSRFTSKKLSKEFGFKVYLGLTLCMKGGHRHNHIRNAHKRMRKCHVCGDPIVKGCEYTDGFSEFQCRRCRTEECREQACLVGLPFGGCEFETRRRRK